MIVSIAIALALGMLTLYCILFFRENGTTENPLEPLKKTLNSARIGEVELLTPPRSAIDVLRDPPKLKTVPNDFPAPSKNRYISSIILDYEDALLTKNELFFDLVKELNRKTILIDFAQNYIKYSLRKDFASFLQSLTLETRMFNPNGIDIFVPSQTLLDAIKEYYSPKPSFTKENSPELENFDYDQVVRSLVQEAEDKLVAIKAKFCTPKYYTLCFKALTKAAMDATGAPFTEISLTGLLVMNVGDGAFKMVSAEKNALFNGFSDLCTSKGIKNRKVLEFDSIQIDRQSYLDYLTKIMSKENSNNKQGE